MIRTRVLGSLACLAVCGMANAALAAPSVTSVPCARALIPTMTVNLSFNPATTAKYTAELRDTDHSLVATMSPEIAVGSTTAAATVRKSGLDIRVIYTLILKDEAGADVWTTSVRCSSVSR